MDEPSPSSCIPPNSGPSARTLLLLLVLSLIVPLALVVAGAKCLQWLTSDIVYTTLPLPDGRSLQAWTPSDNDGISRYPLYAGLIENNRRRNDPGNTYTYIIPIPVEVQRQVRLSWRPLEQSGLYVLTEATAPYHVLLAWDSGTGLLLPDHDAFARSRWDPAVYDEYYARIAALDPAAPWTFKMATESPEGSLLRPPGWSDIHHPDP